CVDTTQAVANPDPFCGFTALSTAGEAPVNGISGVSNSAVVRSRWFGFNYVSGSSPTRNRNRPLCFDLTTFAACSRQPYALNVGSGTMSALNYPPPAVAAIGGDIIVPVNTGGIDKLACFDGHSLANCTGTWPAATGISYGSSYGAPFPLLTNTG